MYICAFCLVFVFLLFIFCFFLIFIFVNFLIFCFFELVGEDDIVHVVIRSDVVFLIVPDVVIFV